MKLRRILYVVGASALVGVVFIIDVIRRSIELDAGGWGILRDLMILGAMVLAYLIIVSVDRSGDQNPLRRLGIMMIAVIVALLLIGGIVSMTQLEFDTKDYTLHPVDYGTLFVSTFLSVLCGLFMLLTLRMLRDLVLYKRRRGTERNFYIFIALVLATGGSTLMLAPLESSVVTTILLVLAIVAGVINAFRLSWIVYLTKREKIFNLIYGFFLFLGFVFLNILIHNTDVKRALLYYSYPLERFVFITGIFGNVYFGMAFISTLFHLPTAEAFERKSSEVTSLHNLSKLVTQVFDFKELVDTVTSMTLQVCEAKSSWLEIIHYPEERAAQDGSADDIVVHNSLVGNYHVQIAAMRNITRQEIDVLLGSSEQTIRDAVFERREPIVIDDIGGDPRFQHLKKEKSIAGSMVVVPLLSHSGLIGILYATKDPAHGFFKDDVNVISAFADHASVAVENSRLINKSLERERLEREMMLAQDMQRRLLPQTLPRFPTLSIDAMSTPAFEVGGDYYDFVHLGDNRLGIVVGDVSGKGVSAAFYMSEVKGIFQALSRMYPMPRQFMIMANDVLSESIDKRSFVSLIYGIVDVKEGILTLCRAGHCPMLYLNREGVSYIRPAGIGMGIGTGDVFARTIEEVTIQLREGDVCVLYTDGVTEARSGEEEFGYDRLLQVTREAQNCSATEIKDRILNAVRAHLGQETSHDDLTLVVLKWEGNGRGTPTTV
jgi:sigma-B regulation protein RsbU (phosphoserine phosphatase)